MGMTTEDIAIFEKILGLLDKYRDSDPFVFWSLIVLMILSIMSFVTKENCFKYVFSLLENITIMLKKLFILLLEQIKFFLEKVNEKEKTKVEKQEEILPKEKQVEVQNLENNNEDNQKVDIDNDVDIVKLTEMLKDNMDIVQNYKSGDFVKDLIVYDLSNSFFDVVCQEYIDFKINYINDAKKHNIVYEKSFYIEKLRIVDSNIFLKIKRSLSERLSCKVLVDKIKFLIEDYEKISIGSNALYIQSHLEDSKFRIINEFFIHENSNIVSFFRRFLDLFKAMNGDLNGLEYKNKIVGMYDSYGILKTNKYFLPHDVSEKDALKVLEDVKYVSKCDNVFFIDFYEYDNGKEPYSQITSLLNSRCSLLLTDYENKDIYTELFHLSTKEAFDNVLLESLLLNEVALKNRNQIQEFTVFRNFLSVAKIERVLIQPVLSNQKQLLGLIICSWNTNKNIDVNSFSDSLKTLAQKSVKLFRFDKKN